MTRSLAAAVTALVLFPPQAPAADPPAGDLAYTPPARPGPPDPAGVAWRLTTLAVGAVGIGMAAWAAVTWKRGGTTAAPAGGRIVRTGTLALSSRSAVCLLQVDGQAVAVTLDGTGLRGMHLLAPAGDEEASGPRWDSAPDVSSIRQPGGWSPG